MGRGRIALFTRDERYAGAFAEYCGKYEKERITVKTFTNSESLENYVVNNKVDMIITEVPLSRMGITEYGGQTVILSEERYVNNIDCPTVYKYQRMDYILRQIYQILADQSSMAGHNCSTAVHGPDIIGCYSPCYEEDREQYARALAEYKGREGRTLFINFAMFTAYDNEGEDGLSELLYYTGSEEGAIEYRLPTLVKYISGYESVPGVKNYIDLYNIGRDVIRSLYDRLRMLSEYKTIVVDIGVLGDAAEGVIEYCSELFMPVPYDADEKRLAHMSNDHAGGGDDITDRVRRIKLPGWWKERPERRVKWVSEVYA